MLDDLYRQLDDAEARMRAAQERLGRLPEVHAKLADVVGHGEAAEGKVVVESTTRLPLQELTIDPRAMRLSSQELADAVKEAFTASLADLREATRTALAEAGIDTGAQRQNAEALREQLASAQAAFTDGTRTAAQRMDEILRKQKRG